MKILHVTAVRKLTQGQRKQLYYEYCCTQELDLQGSWDVLALHDGDIVHPFEANFPRFYKRLFLRNLYTWLYLLKHSSRYDVVLVRHMTFDPFVMLGGWFVRNRLSVHHAKEIDELKLIKKGWRGRFASYLEKIMSKFNFSQILGGVGVTKDICSYQKKLSNRNLKFFLYPNGINVVDVEILKDFRTGEDVNVAFVCGTFSPWHGLDRLIKYLSSLSGDDFSRKLNIHLVGHLPSELYELVGDFNVENCHFHIHGFLSPAEYSRILSKCDFGFGSLAMDRQGLLEGATLKVREYLASGLPVYATHRDVSLPESFEYYLNEPISIKAIETFAEFTKGIARDVVRTSSEEYISKASWMAKLRDDLECI